MHANMSPLRSSMGAFYYFILQIFYAKLQNEIFQKIHNGIFGFKGIKFYNNITIIMSPLRGSMDLFLLFGQ